MPEQNEFTKSTPNSSILEAMEEIWRTTCGTWQNCNETTVQSFLSKCEESNFDPQFCMTWIQHHSDKIPNWSAVADTTQEWVNQHTSTGSPISVSEDNIH
ncbi:hypothetical protein ELQ35_05765 [Peribacillus cavernae]|uniref:Uncharacterized protein n=1 Tax=Peribacillus cavernae TaxID=1674310 RepID=A0A3S0W256_9BACI|nr:hypothetical protein [Peribacillus cavernae]MDQ0220622.1 hypothetical protein [Peribacillus cavernae]RUQ31085.1 hypothetical protein ELQ35_05765 [Peribacillus cavernae]